MNCENIVYSKPKTNDIHEIIIIEGGRRFWCASGAQPKETSFSVAHIWPSEIHTWWWNLLMRRRSPFSYAKTHDRMMGAQSSQEIEYHNFAEMSNNSVVIRKLYKNIAVFHLQLSEKYKNNIHISTAHHWMCIIMLVQFNHTVCRLEGLKFSINSPENGAVDGVYVCFHVYY